VRIPTERERRFRAVKGNSDERERLQIPTNVKGFHGFSESCRMRISSHERQIGGW